MKQEIILTLIHWGIPFLCAGIATVVINYAKNHNKKYDALENGVKALLRAEIVRNYEKYSDRGYCPIYARDPLDKAYEAYHALGGNSTATELYHKTVALPTEKS